LIKDFVFRLSHVHPRYNIPINAILACAIFNIIFGLLYLGPAIAFNAYISSCTIFLNCSYAAPVLLLLIRGRSLISQDKPDFFMGHWTGLAVNVVAVIYVAVTSVFFTFPAAIPVNANTMSKCPWYIPP
jgi:choline transport protein